MHPTLVQFGPIVIGSYTLMLDLGLLAGLGIFYWRARREVDNPDSWLDAALAAVAVGVVGARLGYVAAHWPYYQERLADIPQFWLGGLSWHGGLIGALVGLAAYCAWRRLPLLRVADGLALVAPLTGAAAWVGCWLAGCAYGIPLPNSHWLATDLPDIFGVWAVRANVQLAAAGVSLLVAGALWAASRRAPSGVGLGLFFLLYGAGLGLVDGFRGDAVPHWGAWRLDVVLDWSLAAAGALVIGWVSVRGRKVSGETSGQR